MIFRSFKESESEKLITLPNAMTFGRAIGGVAMGSLLWSHGVDTTQAMIGAGVLTLSDAEGNLIHFTDAHPKLHVVREKLRIMASKIGRKADPVADKIAMVSILVGGAVGGYLPLVDVLPVVATELATSSSSLYSEFSGHDPQVSNVGKAGLVARGSAIVVDLLANDFHGSANEIMSGTGHGLTVAAVILGTLSCFDIIKQTILPADSQTAQF